jgi:hypothetical protein
MIDMFLLVLQAYACCVSDDDNCAVAAAAAGGVAALRAWMLAGTACASELGVIYTTANPKP